MSPFKNEIVYTEIGKWWTVRIFTLSRYKNEFNWAMQTESLIFTTLKMRSLKNVIIFFFRTQINSTFTAEKNIILF